MKGLKMVFIELLNKPQFLKNFEIDQKLKKIYKKYDDEEDEDEETIPF